MEVFGQQDIPNNVAAVGDISCNSNGKQTISMIANSHPNLVIFLGDLSYDKSLACFFEQTKVLENNGTTHVLVTIGNHDIDSGDGNRETKKQLLIHYNIPQVGYYSKTFDLDGSKILVVAMNFTGLEEQEEGNSAKNVLENEQLNFVKNKLENSNATYKIVISHAPFVSAECNSILELFRIISCHSALEEWNNALFNKYHDLFKNTGVDLILSGHNHNYQREEKDGMNYIVSGLGGRSQYHIVEPNDTHFSDVYGFLELKFYVNYIEGKFTSTGGGSMDRDKFTVKER
ncbi:MAG: metallophosphoesterase [Candidatus Nitrosocosmicus sp.]